MTEQAEKKYRETFKKRRPTNLKLLATLALFVFAMVATAVIVRINHIKGLAE